MIWVELFSQNKKFTLKLFQGLFIVSGRLMKICSITGSAFCALSPRSVVDGLKRSIAQQGEFHFFDWRSKAVRHSHELCFAWKENQTKLHIENTQGVLNPSFAGIHW